MEVKVGYLGPAGSFTEQAAKAIFANEKRVPFRTIPDCIDAVNDHLVDYAVVPLENAIEGSVNITLDYLIHHQRMTMTAEVTAPIYQHLMVRKEHVSVWKEAATVFSHPQAIAQCHHFLRNNLPDATITYSVSTAEAAKHVSEQLDGVFAAIANEIAAKEYGLEIVQSEINDYDNNSTRFIVLKKGVMGEETFSGLDHSTYKTTLMVTLPSDFSGALHQVLSAFAWRKLNLSKIESRPMKTGLGNYFFIIDVEMKMDKVLLAGACEEIKALGCGVDILGSYPCFEWKALEAENGALK
ncbi:prephenate dehydratase [Evansella caseinilytica]|uniref:Prephenate dehydratase n=1 Tax=Evansella caseinilytica TaxID=1503961 RepID=A0A1H3K609_9BACI|nr:prephenate dehydratase [Evansella caseinilytica]SDY46954.1 prephenate dehydratase [Evansella caseinilytica]